MFVYASFRVVYVAVHVVAIVISYDSAWSLNRARLSVAIFSHRRVCVLEVCDWCENGTIFFGAHVMLTNAYQRLRLSATMSYCNCGASICLPLKCDAMEERCAVASWCARLAIPPPTTRARSGCLGQATHPYSTTSSRRAFCETDAWQAWVSGRAVVYTDTAVPGCGVGVGRVRTSYAPPCRTCASCPTSRTSDPGRAAASWSSLPCVRVGPAF